MQLLFLLREVVVRSAADAFHSERRPLLKELTHTQHTRNARDEHVKIAGEAVLQRRHAEQPLHQLIGVCAALQVDRDLESVQTRLVSNVGDFLHLALLHKVDDLFHNGFNSRCRRDLGNIDAVCGFIIRVARAHLDAAAACFVDLLHRRAVENDLPAAREVRRLHRRKNVVLRVTNELRRRGAHFGEVKRANGRRHADRNARVCVDEHRGERRRQQRWLFHRTVVIVDKIHGVLVDIAEQLAADGVKARFRVTGSRPRHVTGIKLTEVALRVHIRVQKRLVAAGKTHHRVVNRTVAMRVQLHRLTDDVRAFRARRAEQVHFVHRIEKLSVRGLKAVNLRDGTGHNHAHRIRHVVLPQRVVDVLRLNFTRARNKALHLRRIFSFRLFFSCHALRFLSSEL